MARLTELGKVQIHTSLYHMLKLLLFLFVNFQNLNLNIFFAYSASNVVEDIVSLKLSNCSIRS